jgi:hypothetical protein
MKKSIKKLIALTITTITLMSTTIIPANAEWKQMNDGRWWNSKGDSWSIGWDLIDGKWYYFDGNGIMQTGWLKDTDGKYYYLQTDGSMATNITTPDGYKVDAQGVWIQTTTPIVNNSTTNENIYSDTTKSTTESSQTNTSSSSSSSSSNSSNNDEDLKHKIEKETLTVFYIKGSDKIYTMATGKNTISIFADMNKDVAEATYGVLYVTIPDKTVQEDMVGHYKDYKVVTENGEVKLVKKTETNSTNETTVPTTTPSAVTIS